MKKIIAIAASALFAALLTFGTTVPASAKISDKPLATTPALPRTEVANNCVKMGNMDTKEALDYWTKRVSSEALEWVEDETGGHIRLSDIKTVYAGIEYRFDEPLEPGIYKLTFYVRTAHEGHKSQIRISYKFSENESTLEQHRININNQWTKVETYLQTGSSTFEYFKICHSVHTEYTQPYCIDEVSVVKVDKGAPNPGFYIGDNVSADDAALSSPELFGRDVMWDKEKEEQFEVQGIIMNQDPTSLHWGVQNEEFIRKFASAFADTHITDYVLCAGAGVSMTAPTEVGTEYSEFFDMQAAAGVKPDSFTDSMYKHFVVNGLDYFEILSEEFPKNGINCWISLRMNDSHGIQGVIDTNSLSLSKFYLENPMARRVLYASKNPNSYYNNSMSYASPEVREFHLQLINELLDNYDMYGFLVEWQRDMWLFPIGGEYRGLDTLNQFMRDVEALVSIYEEKYGHEIKIGVDIGSDLQTNYDFGFDIVNWAAEGIIDLVIPRSRWSTTDINVPIRLWKTIMEPYGVKVAGCIEELMRGTSSLTSRHTTQTVFGTASLILSQGADYVYLYNHLPDISTNFKPYDKIAEYTGGYSTAEDRWIKWTTIGSLDKVTQVDRKVVLGFNDMIPNWGGYGQAQQLPLEIRSNQPGALRMYVGNITEDSTVTLSLASTNAKKKNVPTVYINSTPCKYKWIEPNYDGFSDNSMFVYEVPESVFDDMYFVIEVIPNSSSPLNIDHAEVLIETGKTSLY